MIYQESITFAHPLVIRESTFVFPTHFLHMISCACSREIVVNWFLHILLIDLLYFHYVYQLIITKISFTCTKSTNAANYQLKQLLTILFPSIFRLNVGQCNGQSTFGYYPQNGFQCLQVYDLLFQVVYCTSQRSYKR